MYTDAEVRSIGMASLVKALGSVDAERFISNFIRDGGDYTISRRQMFDDMAVDEVFDNASEYMKTHPLSPETKARLEQFRNNEY